MNHCKQCEETITNPVCPDCLERQVTDWLRRRRPEMADEVMDLEKEVYIESATTKCILCDNPMDVCSYCYTESIFTWLKHEDLSLLKEFVTFFNFDLRGKGYTEQLEELGVYV